MIGTKKDHHAAGMSLLEILAYIAILTVIVNLAAGVFVSSTRLSALSTVALANLDTLEDIRRDFTDTVRASSGVCEQIGSYHSGDGQLVLRLPARHGQKEVHRYAVFGRLDDKPRLYHLVLADKGENGLALERAATYRRDFSTVRFSYGTARDLTQARLVSLTLEPARGRRYGDIKRDVEIIRRPPTVYRYSAAIRNMD